MAPRNTSEVIAFTVTQTNLAQGGSNHKFYSIYVVDNVEIRNNGRIGAIGQIQSVETHRDHATALRSAQAQITKKQRGGYLSSPMQEDRFSYPTDKVALLDRVTAKDLVVVYKATGLPGSTPERLLGDGPTSVQPARATAPAPTTVMGSASEAIQALTARILAAVQVSVADPVQAHVEYATINEEFEKITAALDEGKSFFETLEMMVTE